MSAYLGIDHIVDSGPLVRIDHHNLPDLDMLMLDVYAWQVAEDVIQPWEEPYSYEHEGKTVAWGGDEPTRVEGTWYTRGDGLMVRWLRKNPCACGDEHTFDMDDLGYDENAKLGRPTTKRIRGAFMGVYFG